MKITYLILAVYLSVQFSFAQTGNADRTKFNDNWLFNKEATTNAHATNYNDKNWRQLNLPHDWAIEGPFSEEFDARTGGLPIFGTAWYRKHFTIDKNKKGQNIIIFFDGVMNNSTVYINGTKVGERPFGYIGFEVDLTPYIKFDAENVIAVKVNPEELSARWYPGAGIYRNVYLEVKNPVHVASWGTYITTPEITAEKALVHVETTVNNRSKKKGSFSLKTTLLNKQGKEVASTSSNIKVGNSSNAVLKQELNILKPELWDLENPHMYTAKTQVSLKGKVIDTYHSKFGVRTIEYSNTKGFLLNGKQRKFQGVCLHHDLGPLGAAVNYRATERQLEIMKSMGVNAIRTSHNPPSPEQLELCDKMGIMVQVEAFDCWKDGKTENDYGKYWDQWHERDLRDMIIRDRNHPSVVMWSIGNELKEQRSPTGGALAQKLTDICHDEDPTRPVTAGLSQHIEAIKNGLADAIDVVGFNYKPTQYDIVLSEHPEWLVYGSETSSCVSSRGEYHLPVEKYDKHESLQVSSYDIISPPWAYAPDFEIYAQKTMTRSLGEFIWTGFDYLGEPTPYNGRDNETHGKWGGDWPSRSSYFGTVDLCGFPKDRYYFYQSVWTKEPMVHLLPHWNWEGQGHDTIPVYSYTNCESAELFLNGKSLGKKTMGVDKTTIPAEFKWWKRPETTWDSPYRLNWNVPYEPGELKIVAYNDGKVAATKTIVTAGAAANIVLSSDRNTIQADGEDLTFITVKIEDKNGNFCPTANNLIDFKVTGPATIAAVGNGNAATTESFQASYRKAFNGLCMLILKSKLNEPGTIRVEASSEGLKLGTIEVSVK